MEFDLNYLNNFKAIIGCDEVGRGPLAGPVVGCAARVELSSLQLLKDLGLTDSKKLTDKKREKIINELSIELVAHKKINHQLFSYCLWEHGPEEIDQMNILQASLSAMKHSAQAIVSEKEIILIDGNKTFDLAHSEVESVVKGDSKSLVIGLASVIAKVYRDRLMRDLGEQYPGYGLERHAGYPTKAHKEAISQLGVTPIHRKTFKGVKEFI